MLEKVRYRIRQFLQAIHVSISKDEEALIAEILSPPAQILFYQMPLDAQHHSLNVLYTLRLYNEPVDSNLAVAALLHDVGKVASEKVGIKIGLWLRGPLVLFNALLPKQMKSLAQEDTIPRNVLACWRYVLYVYLEHPAIGAEWAKAADCSPLTCWLIAYHQTEIGKLGAVDENWKKCLIALQQADGLN